MWTSITQEQINQAALEAFLPVVLLLNYTLLMYLAVFYWKRRRERRVMLLLFVGTLGTVAIIPFARPDHDFVEAVNDISEACCVLTFLLQITIIGYDLNKRFKIRSVIQGARDFKRRGEPEPRIHLHFPLLLHRHLARMDEHLEDAQSRSVLLPALRHPRNAV
ncbi:hypothetical protein PHYSODRAFT_486531 [Phytophthora sojae]|uniref:Uncharacterized protein n=1 Tax=Phytophthora sojae (strain P6497) TaxID=1094619 RepID=G4YX09_PHYSP|nr:hypothetical protein PHYSODRAFT_486531 [Phytophthora sojae]EGZ25016.1 hypothetical protein PHYSODRAFT_486531 [Phytophthora sojae]|eukprot:XP_009520304.1 hypothetical protein PHYSODRAFT_486531 [Phytophthora sojae]